MDRSNKHYAGSYARQLDTRIEELATLTAAELDVHDVELDTGFGEQILRLRALPAAFWLDVQSVSVIDPSPLDTIGLLVLIVLTTHKGFLSPEGVRGDHF